MSIDFKEKVTGYLTSYFLFDFFQCTCYTDNIHYKEEDLHETEKSNFCRYSRLYRLFKTISRYFNNPDSLTLENQEKITHALDVLGYQENKLAKVLANGKSEFVGIIIPNLYLHYYSEMLNQLLSTYEKYNYKFLVFIGNNKKEIEEKYIHELMAYKIEGLIVLSNTISSEELASYKLPVVTIERECDHVCSVSTDNYLGGVQATSLLIRNKCDVILHINSIFPDTLPTYGRIRGFEDICNEHHVVHELIQRNLGNTYQETLTQLKNIFNEIEEKYPSQKKGVFLANDTYASMFLNLIFQKYGKLPKDYQIVGFDDSPIASEAILPITTVGQQIEKIAQTAMELLVLQMNEMKKRKPAPLKEPVHKQITPVLIRRNTTD